MASQKLYYSSTPNINMVHPDGSVITFIGNFLVTAAEAVVEYLEEEIAKNHPLLRKATVEEYTVALADPFSPLVGEKEIVISKEEVLGEKEQRASEISQQETTSSGSSLSPADPLNSRSSTIRGGNSSL